MAEFSEHEADGSQKQEGQVLAGHTSLILGEAAGAVQPSNRTLHNPALGQHREALGSILPFDDLYINVKVDPAHAGLERRSLIAAVGVQLE